MLKSRYAVDSAATIHVYNDFSGLTDVHAQHLNYFTSNGERAKSTHVGIHPIFGLGAIEPNAVVNILSVSELRGKFYVDLNGRTDRFTLRDKTTPKVFFAPFDPTYKLYLVDEVEKVDEDIYVMSRIDYVKEMAGDIK